MTKYDIRLRRKALSKGQIERHKDFKSLYGTGATGRSEGSAWFKVIALVLATLAIVAMIVLGVRRLSQPHEPVPQEEIDIFDEFKSE